MLTIVSWKWHQPNYRSKFTAEHVNILQRMVERNLTIPHRFVCITDDPKGVECETIPLWDSPNICLPSKRPNCYRRLKVFARDAGEWLGERILSIDLDTVIMRNIDHIAGRTEDFVAFGDTAKSTHYNGGLFLLRAGAFPEVWENFTEDAPRLTKGIVGSDQAWISHTLGPGKPVWGPKDGVYSYRVHLREGRLPVPKDCAILSMHGKNDPWTVNDKRIKEHYR